MAFLADISEDKNKVPDYSLYVWEGGDKAVPVVDNNDESLPGDWIISENGTLSFSRKGNRLFFGTAPHKKQKDSTILEEEIPVLDVWHWNEDILQTVQIKNKLYIQKMLKMK